MIFNANREAIAANTSNLPVGLQLGLPCEDARLAADNGLSSILAEETKKQEAVPKGDRPYAPPLKFVTANLEEAGATEKVELDPALSAFNTNHLATHMSNPRGSEYIAMLNAGLT